MLPWTISAHDRCQSLDNLQWIFTRTYISKYLQQQKFKQLLSHLRTRKGKITHTPLQVAELNDLMHTSLFKPCLNMQSTITIIKPNHFIFIKTPHYVFLHEIFCAFWCKRRKYYSQERDQAPWRGRASSASSRGDCEAPGWIPAKKHWLLTTVIF